MENAKSRERGGRDCCRGRARALMQNLILPLSLARPTRRSYLSYHAARGRVPRRQSVKIEKRKRKRRDRENATRKKDKRYNAGDVGDSRISAECGARKALPARNFLRAHARHLKISIISCLELICGCQRKSTKRNFFLSPVYAGG